MGLALLSAAAERRQTGAGGLVDGRRGRRLIRLTWPDTPFLYVSGLTDLVGRFNAR